MIGTRSWKQTYAFFLQQLPTRTSLLHCLPILLILLKTPKLRQSLGGLPHGMSLGIVRARPTLQETEHRENKKI
jgi:hypothetical protein